MLLAWQKMAYQSLFVKPKGKSLRTAQHQRDLPAIMSTAKYVQCSFEEKTEIIAHCLLHQLSSADLPTVNHISWLLTCVESNSGILSFSVIISGHCSNTYYILDTSSEVSDVYRCVTCIHYGAVFSISPLNSIEGATPLWFSPSQRHRGCCDFSDSEIPDSFRLCELDIWYGKDIKVKRISVSPLNISYVTVKITYWEHNTFIRQIRGTCMWFVHRNAQ